MSDSSLTGRTALVTGAARRIGRALSLALAHSGVNVVIHANRSLDDANSLADEIRSLSVKAFVLSADLSDPDETDSLIPRALDAAGPIDFLVNNASIFDTSTLSDFSFDVLAANVQVNAFAPLQLARAFNAQSRPGAIVNFLDTRVTAPDPAHAAYHLSKRLLLSLTSMMALEFAPSVRVNAVAPGLILPPPGQDESYLQRLASSNPLQHVGSPRDVTDAVLFLLRSDFITGQVLYIDGGYHLKGRTYE